MGESYLPKNVGAQAEPYLPPEAREKTVKIVGPPPPMVDMQRQNRLDALKLSVQQSPEHYDGAEAILKKAVRFEAYLKDGTVT